MVKKNKKQIYATNKGLSQKHYWVFLEREVWVVYNNERT